MSIEKIVSLCKRRGFLFQSSEIYGGLNGFWDYGPLGVELKRNIKNAWWQDMVTGHDDMNVLPGAPEPYAMVGLDTTIIMHPQIWKCSGHYDLFCDMMVDCRETKGRYRADHIQCYAIQQDANTVLGWIGTVKDPEEFEKGLSNTFEKKIGKLFGNQEVQIRVHDPIPYTQIGSANWGKVLGPDASSLGTLTEPREFNLMFKTIVGALGTEEDAAFLRPETAQGIFVNFKNVMDCSRVRIPFGIAQIGKSFRNEITPRNFTFRSREFEQMEIEFFCHPNDSRRWYEFWRDRRLKWYTELGLSGERLQLREHGKDELSHYSVGTADIEYAFPFLGAGEFGELEGIAHRGDFDLRSHMEGKLIKNAEGQLEVEKGPDGKPKWKGSGKDLSYRDELTNERYIPHVIEPSAGADRAALAFLCQAYHEDQAPDEDGSMQTRVVMRLHPRLAPIKAAVFPLVKKDGMPEVAKEIYLELKREFNVFYDEKGAVGRRYRRQDEAGTPFCITVDGQTSQDRTVTIRDRDTLKQSRIKIDQCLAAIRGCIATGTMKNVLT